MKIIRNFQNINKADQGSVLTLGNFDGVHLGHQEILNDIYKISEELKSPAALLTFEPHPLKIVQPKFYKNCNRINSLAGKLDILSKQNLLDLVFVTNFNQKLANMSAEDFVKRILVDKLKIKYLLVGHDFTFGKNRSGNSELLSKLSKEFGFKFKKIHAATNQNQKIYSSTSIRKLINEGDVQSAQQMMGRPYQISGIVRQGQKIANKIGFPTANIAPKFNIIQPKYGVYVANIRLLNGSKTYPAILNFGIKPTFSGKKPLFEVHIFDFNQDIYGKRITIELLDFIRNEHKFNSVEELQLQIKKDCEIAKLYHKTQSPK